MGLASPAVAFNISTVRDVVVPALIPVHRLASRSLWLKALPNCRGQGQRHIRQCPPTLLLQVFDKALTETTFSEIYAEMCRQLNARLPTFEPVKEGKKQQSTFRKQLLNKCQEEFEKGAAAMDAVTAREKAEKDKVKDADEEVRGCGRVGPVCFSKGCRPCCYVWET